MYSGVRRGSAPKSASARPKSASRPKSSSHSLSLSGVAIVGSPAPGLVEDAGGASAVPEDIVRLFQYFDEDGNGQIDRGELASVLQKLDGTYWTMKRIRDLFRAADQDRDQFISWAEFLKWVFASGEFQRVVRDALPALDNIRAAEQQTRSDHLSALTAAESTTALASALEAALPLFKEGELEDHERRLEDMRLPFSVTVSTLAGLSCAVEVTREQDVMSLCHEVAKLVDKKAYRIMLAHADGRLEPPTATLEECGVTGPHVQLGARFGEADPLLELSLPEFLASLVQYKLATESEIGTLQQQCGDGKLSEDDCRIRFKGKLLAAMEAEEKRRRDEEERERKIAEEKERERQATQARRDAMVLEQQTELEALTSDALLVLAEEAGFGQNGDDLMQLLSLLNVNKACKAEVENLQCIGSEVEAQTQKLADEARGIKDSPEVQKILERCLPELEFALKKWDGLRKSDIQELMCLKNPPRVLYRTLAELCKFYGLKPDRVKTEEGKLAEDYWPTVGRFIISNPRFLDQMRDFDKDNIDENRIRQLSIYLEDETSTPEANAKCSRFGEAVCVWLRAMHNYHFGSKELAPYRMLLAQKERELEQSMTLLNENRSLCKQRTEDLEYFAEVLEKLRSAKP